jgi:acetyl-CoA carboxylase biotin carboxyl carrier protein
MNLDIIKQLLDLVRAHDLAEFELEHEGIKIRVRKDLPPAWRGPATAPIAVPAIETPEPRPSAPPVAAALPIAPPRTAADNDGEGEGQGEIDLAMVTSPIVGTFYRAPEPSADNFTDVGQAVKRGQVLCIIEAMKLMNEIESEYEGEVMKVFVENGQPVQYGERLFAIKVR